LPSIPPTTITPEEPLEPEEPLDPEEPLEPDDAPEEPLEPDDAPDEPLEPDDEPDDPTAPELPELPGKSPGHGVTQPPPQSIPVSSPSRTPFLHVGLVSATLLPVLPPVPASFADEHAVVEARVPSKTSIPATAASVRITASSPRSCSDQEGGWPPRPSRGDGL
jgi:hypothetical protein